MLLFMLGLMRKEERNGRRGLEMKENRRTEMKLEQHELLKICYALHNEAKIFDKVDMATPAVRYRSLRDKIYLEYKKVPHVGNDDLPWEKEKKDG